MLLLSSQRVFRPTYSSRPSIAWKPLWCKYNTVFRRGVIYKLFWRQCSCKFKSSNCRVKSFFTAQNYRECFLLHLFFLLTVQLPCRYLRNVGNYINNTLLLSQQRTFFTFRNLGVILFESTFRLNFCGSLTTGKFLRWEITCFLISFNSSSASSSLLDSDQESIFLIRFLSPILFATLS